MAKPKPPEELESITVRLPSTAAKRLRSLANQANSGMGISLNKHCVAILIEAAERGVVVDEVTSYSFSKPISGSEPIAAEPESEPYATEKDEGPRKRA